MVANNQMILFPEYRPRAEKPRTVVGRFLLLGAGVQSSCLAEMIVEGEIPPVDLVIFADTGNEPEWVYKQVKYLTGRLASVGIPLLMVKKDGLGLIENLTAADATGRFATMPLFTVDGKTGRAGQMRRQCTSEYKIVPSDSTLRQWLFEHGHALLTDTGARVVSRRVAVECIYGISADEMYRQGKRGTKWQRALYPLIDMGMTREDCVTWLKAHGLPVPFKSSCKVCPYHQDSYWLWLATDYPAVFEEACVFDDWLRSPEAKERMPRLRQDCYLHSSCKPLREVDFTRPTARPSARREVSPLQIELMGSTCSTDGGFSCFS